MPRHSDTITGCNKLIIGNNVIGKKRLDRISSLPEKCLYKALMSLIERSCTYQCILIYLYTHRTNLAVLK